MTPANVRNMAASQAYGVRAEELVAIVKSLEADVNKSMIDAQNAHWGHVGDLSRAIELAQQLRDLLRHEVK